MCQGFGCIVTENKIFFIEPTMSGNISHEDIILRAGFNDERIYDRHFVRVEFPHWTEKSFRWDEGGTLPIWLEHDEQKEKACKLMLRVREHYDEFRRLANNASRRDDRRCTFRSSSNLSVSESRNKYRKEVDSYYTDFLSKISKISGYLPIRGV